METTIFRALVCSSALGFKVIITFVMTGLSLAYLIFLCNRKKPIYMIPLALTLGMTVLSAYLSGLSVIDHMDLLYGAGGDEFSLFVLLFDYVLVILATTYGYSLIVGIRAGAISLCREKRNYERVGERAAKTANKEFKSFFEGYKEMAGDKK